MCTIAVCDSALSLTSILMLSLRYIFIHGDLMKLITMVFHIFLLSLYDGVVRCYNNFYRFVFIEFY